MKRTVVETNRAQNVEDLHKQIKELESKVAHLAINRYTKPGKNVREMRGMKRSIAQIQTIIGEK